MEQKKDTMIILTKEKWQVLKERQRLNWCRLKDTKEVGQLLFSQEREGRFPYDDQ